MSKFDFLFLVSLKVMWVDKEEKCFTWDPDHQYYNSVRYKSVKNSLYYVLLISQENCKSFMYFRITMDTGEQYAEYL